MGLLDTLLGKSKLPKPKPDRLFAMSTAYVTLNTNLSLVSKSAGICFKPLEVSRFMSAEIEIRELLQQSTKETNTQYSIKKDSYGYMWIVLNDPDFEEILPQTSTDYALAIMKEGNARQRLAERGVDIENNLKNAVRLYQSATVLIYVLEL
jgi:hypothetical protein